MISLAMMALLVERAGISWYPTRRRCPTGMSRLPAPGVRKALCQAMSRSGRGSASLVMPAAAMQPPKACSLAEGRGTRP